MVNPPYVVINLPTITITRPSGPAGMSALEPLARMFERPGARWRVLHRLAGEQPRPQACGSFRQWRSPQYFHGGGVRTFRGPVLGTGLFCISQVYDCHIALRRWMKVSGTVTEPVTIPCWIRIGLSLFVKLVYPYL